MPAIEKELADLILDTDLPKEETRKQLIDWLLEIGLPIVLDNSK